MPGAVTPTSRSSSAYTAEEVAFIKANSATMTRATIAKTLGRGRAGLGRYILRMGLPTSNRGYRRWTGREVNKLYLLVERYGHGEIAKRLGRDKHSVANKIAKLGLTTRTEVYSLNEAAQLTGYNPLQLKRAKIACGQDWKLTEYRGPSGRLRRFTITGAQLAEISAYFRRA